MKKQLLVFLMLLTGITAFCQQRRPIDSRHPLWIVHIDVWNGSDPQKIIDLVPEDVRPYVCMNLSMSCQFDTKTGVYKMPQDAVQTYKSWATVCQKNKVWFMCQPASGGMTHILDSDLTTFEYFFKNYPNFLGWNYCEQFWGFDDKENLASSPTTSRIELFAKLVEMSHNYGGFLTISFCGNIWSHPLTPNAMLRRNNKLLTACKNYPEACLWLYKYTTSSCWYNTESVCISPFISGLATNYGVRYDCCGWNTATDVMLGEGHGKYYPIAAGISTVMEQTCVNGGAVWDGPELIPYACFRETNTTDVDGYTRRNWESFPEFKNAWTDMFRKIIDGGLYIPSRQEVVEKTKVAVIADMQTGSDEDKYSSWKELYDGIYKQDNDPYNSLENGYWQKNLTYFKKTGRYAAIPVCIGMYDNLSKVIPVQVNKSQRASVWPDEAAKVRDFDKQYPVVSTGDLYVSRFRNQLITYTPYTYLNTKTSAKGTVSLEYNTCNRLEMTWGKLSTAAVREYADHINFYFNNFRTDTVTNVVDKIVITGAASKPTYELKRRGAATASVKSDWNADRTTFTLEVSHCGPVDVSIKCSGNGTNRKTDYLPSEALTADMPVQPAAYSGPVTIEAEDMDYKAIGACITNQFNQRSKVRGHSGNGFMEMGRNAGGSLRHRIKMDKAGDYKIAVKYSAKRAGKLDVVLNGVTKQAAIEKCGTNQWKKTFVEAAMTQGNNTLYINNTEGIDMMIDYIVYMPKDTPEEKYTITMIAGDNGKATPDVKEATEGTVVTFNIQPDEGYEFAGWELHPRQHPYFKDNTMSMPNDNVILKPLFKQSSGGGIAGDMHDFYNLDLSNVESGAMPEGWECLQNGNELHSYPNTYSGGARTFVGFTGFQGKALYWRSKYAEYGRQENYPLELEPGNYRVTYAMAAWKKSPVYELQILDAANDNIIARSEQTAAEPDANGSKSADVSDTEVLTFDFKIETKGRYVLRFNNVSGGDWDEFLLLSCKMQTDSATEISSILCDSENVPVAIYGEDGIRHNALRRGINIVKMKNGETKKIFIK